MVVSVAREHALADHVRRKWHCSSGAAGCYRSKNHLARHWPRRAVAQPQRGSLLREGAVSSAWGARQLAPSAGQAPGAVQAGLKGRVALPALACHCRPASPVQQAPACGRVAPALLGRSGPELCVCGRGLSWEDSTTAALLAILRQAGACPLGAPQLSARTVPVTLQRERPHADASRASALLNTEPNTQEHPRTWRA